MKRIRESSVPSMYTIIQPPFTLKFREMSKRELRDYFKWFLQSIPERISALADAVRETGGFQDWEPDYSPESLGPLGDWFSRQVETRPKTAKELDEIHELCGYPIVGRERQLTNRTISIAIDVGMYFSQVLLHNHPSLKWELPLGSKNFADYGQPVLKGSGHAVLNPVAIATVLAYGFADGTKSGKRLHDVYYIWERSLSVAPEIHN